jgi:hypothetical protein
MEATRISVSGLTSISKCGGDGSQYRLTNCVDVNERSKLPTKYEPLTYGPMTFIKENGYYYPDYKSHDTDGTHDIELKPSTNGSINGHTPLNPFFSRHLAKKVVDQAASQNVSLFPGQCRLESIHFPDDHAPASSPTSTMNDDTENPASRKHEPKNSVFTFVVEDPKELSMYPSDNFVTQGFAWLDRLLLNPDPL